jgi:hypothetical protein
MPMYAVTYTASVWVEAHDEEEAIDLAIEEWEDHPDGTWEAQLVED